MAPYFIARNKFSENSEKGVDSYKFRVYYNHITKKGELKMLTNGLNMARAYFNIFRGMVTYYFAYFRLLILNSFA